MLLSKLLLCDEAVFLNAKNLEHEVTVSSLYLHTLTSSFTCMKMSEEKKRAILPWLVKADTYNIRDLDFWCLCWRWKNMKIFLSNWQVS